MPPDFRQISRLTLSCQQLLLPKPWTFHRGGDDGIQSVNVTESLIIVKQSKLLWCHHYNCHQSCNYHSPCESRLGLDHSVSLRSRNECPDNQRIGPSHVDCFYSASDGIWFPDSLEMSMVWEGGPKTWDSCAKEFNPFFVNKIEHDIACYFTEETKEKKIQWTLIQPGFTLTKKSRGNKAIALQELSRRPKWLTKESYFHMGRLRAYPNMMLRYLVTTLHEGGLPLDNQDVKRILEMVIFHVGDIEVANDSVNFIWKTDLKKSDDWLSCFCNVLSGIVDKLKECPSAFHSLATVGELLNYGLNMCSFERENVKMKTRFESLVREGANAMINFAEEIALEVHQSNVDERHIPGLRTKQGLLLYHGVLILGRTSLSSERDVQIIISSMVKASNLFIDTDHEFFEELKQMRVRCRESISKQIPEVIELSLRNNGDILTRALRETVTYSPESLHWEFFQPQRDTKSLLFSCCFQAISTTNIMYCLNALDGTILVDGCPIALLPAEVTENSLYVKSFGIEKNFEVLREGDVFKTIHATNGRHHSFQIIDGKLVVDEIFGFHQEQQMELLDNATIKEWGIDLPLRYKELCSYWVDRKRKEIAVRGTHFMNRLISAIITYSSGTNNSVYIVPKHEQIDCLMTLSLKKEGFKKLLVGDSSLIDTLSKFEDRKFIHTLSSPKFDCIYFELPRFKLSFELRNEELNCLEFVGFKLSTCQQLRGTLWGFYTYLLLECNSKPNTFQSKAEVLITPNRTLLKQKVLMVELKSDSKTDSSQEYFQYNVHNRLEYLTANDIYSRLHLVGLHISTSVLLREPSLGMTGEERSLQLLRQCSSTKVLSDKMFEKLSELKGLCISFPTALLLCYDLERNADRIRFLYSHTDNPKNAKHRSSAYTISDTMSAYKREKQLYPMSFRRLLMPQEEFRCLGTYISGVGVEKGSLNLEFHDRVAAETCQLSTRGENMLMNVKEQLDVCISRKAPLSNIGHFPLQNITIKTDLEKDIYGELKRSWDAYEAIDEFEIVNKDTEVRSIISTKQHEVNQVECEIREFLLSTINSITLPLNEQEAHHQSLRVANFIPSCSLADLLSICSWKTHKLELYNPFLTDRIGITENIYELILVWLQICVLQDKLDRLLNHSMRMFEPKHSSYFKQLFIEEIRVVREWVAKDYPHWLVFEVEGGIQIRREQYAIARHLLQNPGHIMQLNMGLGKTRVILPMIILHQTSQEEKGPVVRVHLLSSLFDEAYEFLHKNLCASVLMRRIFTMPFCRDVSLNHVRIRTLQRMVNECLLEKGFIMITPEHRLSLELKRKELHLFSPPEKSDNSKELSKILHHLIEDTKWCNIFDESDELLHHRFQLIYAVGNVSNIPDGTRRWKYAEALMDILHNQLFLKKISETLIADTKSQMVQYLLNNPPDDLAWIKFCSNEEKLAMRRVIIDSKTNPLLIRDTFLSLPDTYYKDILALRGFLGHEVLYHCLYKRNRVDFGIARGKKGRKKRLAVPFRGADTPSERSEFTHPDIAICLSIIAYYEDGLTKDQVVEAFATLLKCSEKAKQHHFECWFKLSKQNMKIDVEKSLDKVEKIDLTSMSQLGQLVRKLIPILLCVYTA